MSDSYSFDNNNLGAFIENRFGDRYLYSVNGTAFDKIGADSVYTARWGEQLFRENTLYIVAGGDSGVFIDYIRRHGLPEGSRYLIVELPELLPVIKDAIGDEEDISDAKDVGDKRAMSQKEALSSNKAPTKRIHTCEQEQWLTTAQNLSLREYAYLDAVTLIRSVAAEDCHLLAYSDFWRRLEQSFRHTLWEFGIEFGNLTFITRQIENLAENRHSASLIKNSFPGKTAVLLAGGPSLDLFLPWVKQHRRDIVVIAVSRISRRLLQVDIEPDIVVTVDPHQCSFDVSKHMLLFRHTLLVNAYHATPQLIGQWRGRSLYLDHRFPWKIDTYENIIVGMGPTVSNSAISLIIAMGFSQVVFVGLDLCFSQEGFSHAQGSDERASGAFVAYGGQTVHTNCGGVAETDNAFFNAVSSIEKQVLQGMQQGIRFINPSANAAAIKHVEFITLQDITLSPLDQPAHETMTQLLPLEGATERLTIYHQTLKVLNQTEFKLIKLQNQARKALQHNDGLFGRNGKQKNFKHKLKMDRVEKQIGRDIGILADLSKIFGMSAFVKTLRPDDNREWSDEEIEETGKRYYEAYLFGSGKLLSVVRQQQSRLRARIQEDSENPDFNCIFEQWKLDNQPGRSQIWQQQNPERFISLTPDLQQRFQVFAELFQAELANTQHGHMNTIRRYAELNAVIGRLLEFSQNKDLAGMQRLLRGLNARQETEAVHLQTLVRAYIAEYQENMQTAVDCYRQLIELDVNNYPRIVENALIRLSFLSMSCSEFGIAADCMKSLAAISPAYLPHYAEILRISSKIQDAIDVYTHYLSQVQDDLASMLKLGIIYKNLGVREGAFWLFDYVCKKDPGNTAAQSLLKELERSA